VRQGTPNPMWQNYNEEIWGESPDPHDSSTDDSTARSTARQTRKPAGPPGSVPSSQQNPGRDSSAVNEPFAKFLRPPQTREEALEEGPLPTSLLNFSPDPTWAKVFQNIKDLATAVDDEVSVKHIQFLHIMF
jgi:hypothetical protein